MFSCRPAPLCHTWLDECQCLTVLCLYVWFSWTWRWQRHISSVPLTSSLGFLMIKVVSQCLCLLLSSYNSYYLTHITITRFSLNSNCLSCVRSVVSSLSSSETMSAQWACQPLCQCLPLQTSVMGDIHVYLTRSVAPTPRSEPSKTTKSFPLITQSLKPSVNVLCLHSLQKVFVTGKKFSAFTCKQDHCARSFKTKTTGLKTAKKVSSSASSQDNITGDFTSWLNR